MGEMNGFEWLKGVGEESVKDEGVTCSGGDRGRTGSDAS